MSLDKKSYRISGDVQQGGGDVSGSLGSSGHLNFRQTEARTSYRDLLIGEGSGSSPSWTQADVGLNHAFVIPAISSSRHEEQNLNAYFSGSQQLEFTDVAASGNLYYSKRNRFIRKTYAVTASDPIYLTNNPFHGFEGATMDFNLGLQVGVTADVPAFVDVEVPDHGRLRDIKVWVELVTVTSSIAADQDIPVLTGSRGESSGPAQLPFPQEWVRLRRNKLQSLRRLTLGVRSPNVKFNNGSPILCDSRAPDIFTDLISQALTLNLTDPASTWSSMYYLWGNNNLSDMNIAQYNERLNDSHGDLRDFVRSASLNVWNGLKHTYRAGTSTYGALAFGAPINYFDDVDPFGPTHDPYYTGSNTPNTYLGFDLPIAAFSSLVPDNGGLNAFIASSSLSTSLFPAAWNTTGNFVLITLSGVLASSSSYYPGNYPTFFQGTSGSAFGFKNQAEKMGFNHWVVLHDFSDSRWNGLYKLMSASLPDKFYCIGDLGLRQPTSGSVPLSTGALNASGAWNEARQFGASIFTGIDMPVDKNGTFYPFDWGSKRVAIWDTDFGIRTIFHDNAPAANPLHLNSLFTDDTGISHGDVSFLSGNSPNHIASMRPYLSRSHSGPGTVWNNYNFSTVSASHTASAYGRQIPWFLDDGFGNVPMQINDVLQLCTPEEITRSPSGSYGLPPKGWLNGPEGISNSWPLYSATFDSAGNLLYASGSTPRSYPTAGENEWPTMGMSLGPNEIRPTYPLLDDVMEEAIFLTSSLIQEPEQSFGFPVPGGANNTLKLKGFRPGLRGSEVNGTWQFMILWRGNSGQAKCYFRQIRLELLIDQGEDFGFPYPSRKFMYNTPSYVPAKAGSRVVQFVSGVSLSNTEGVMQTTVNVPEQYGRSIGITDNFSGSIDDFAVFVRLTGTLADSLTGSDGVNVRSTFLNNEFRTPYIPISSGSNVSSSFEFSAEEAQASRDLFNSIFRKKHLVNQADTLQAHLNRASVDQTSAEQAATKVASGSIG